jgi:hypothetical protein
MTRNIHGVAALVAYAMIALFWGSTVVSELLLSDAAVVWVKGAIRVGLLWLVPALAVTGTTGFLLARGRGGQLIRAKKTRMPFIGLNGLLVLVPSALFLAGKAEVARFDGAFYAVQAVELVGGAINLALMTLSVRDGLRMSGRLNVARWFRRPQSGTASGVREPAKLQHPRMPTRGL